jgi:hypothetical protein
MVRIGVFGRAGGGIGLEKWWIGWVGEASILSGGAILRDLSSFRACVGRGKRTHDEQSEAL